MEESDESLPELDVRLRELRVELRDLRGKQDGLAQPASLAVLQSSVKVYLPRLAEILGEKPAEMRALLPDLVKDGVMVSEGRGRSRFEFKLAPLGAMATLAPSGRYPSSRATPSPTS